MVGWAIVEAWRPTTVHGVHECYRRFSLRFVFIVTWSCVCLGFGLWEMSNTLTIFLQYAVKTSAEVTEAKREGIPFPAITICHSSIGKKSFFGGSKSLTAAMMSMLTRTTDVTKLVSIIDSCTDKSVREANVIGRPLSEVLQESMFDSRHAVKDCKWNRQKLNCSRLFVNKPNDSGVCFTFNPSEELLRAYHLVKKNDEHLWRWNGTAAYGTSVMEMKRFISNSPGIGSGLSLLLLTDSSDYCGSLQESAGFLVLVHDRSAEPLLQMTKDIRLSPGFVANVAMSLRKIERKTESYGFCKSYQNLRMYKGDVPYTTSDYFTQSCLSEKIMLKCGCLPFYKPRANAFTIREVPELSEEKDLSKYIPSCGFDNNVDQLNCQIAVENILLRANSSCYHSIPKPCRSTRILTQVSFAKFPTAKIVRRLNEHLGTKYSLSQFSLNFVSVNFFFRENEFTTVTEKIKMTWVDLMNQMGGAAGMTLGISIVGIVESLLWLLTRPILLARNLVSRVRRGFQQYGRFSYKI